MPLMKQIGFVSVLVCALLSTTAAQDSTTVPKTTLTITANAIGDRVRVTAPSSVVQLHLEVYASGGERLFDQEIRGGNIFDWHLQDGQAQRLAAGVYVCVVTAKSISGKLTQKLGTVTVAEKSASVQPAGSLQLSLQQTQVIGPVEADSSWTIAGENEPQTPTVIANDGTDGQMIRGRGALTFRIGNFFSGIDQEQMRLTEAGDLGIGTATPQSKLDVVGTIRAQRFLVVKPGSRAAGDLAPTSDSGNSVQPLVSGVGTTGQLTKWTDGASGTLGDSVITETAGGNVGIGTVSPGVALDVFTSGASTDLKVREASRTVDLSSNWTGGISGIGTLTNNKFGLAANGGIRLLVDPSGNVGIGTTAPGNRLEVRTGTVNDGALIYNTNTITGGSTPLFLGTTNTTGNVANVSIEAASNSGATAADLILRTGNATANSFGTPRLFIRGSDGNVGIGTTAPTSNLTVTQGNIGPGLVSIVNGSATVTGTNTQFINTFRVGDTIVPNPGPGINIAYPITAIASDTSLTVNTPLASTASNVPYSLIGGTRLAVKGNGNVGIGTDSPIENLDVQSTSDTVIRARAISDHGQHTSATLMLDRGTSAQPSSAQIKFLIGDFPEFAMGTNQPLAGSSDFSIYSFGTNSNALTIQKSSGNVGIGITVPNAPLDVLAPSGKEILFGGGNATGSEIKFTNSGTQHFSIYNSGDSNLTFAKTSSDIATNTAGTALMTISSGGNVGIGTNASASNRLEVNGQTRTGTLFIDTYVSQVTNGLPLCTTSAAGANQNLVGLCNSSSLRYKTNVNFFRAGLNVISRLRPISFDWKENGARDVGLAAEEVEKVEPLLTFRNQKGEIEGVRYDRLGVLFINAFNEQQQQIARQQVTAKHQQEQIEALRKANDALNTRLQLIERTLKIQSGSVRRRR